MFTIDYDKDSAANRKLNPNDTYFTDVEKRLIEEACSETSRVSRLALQGVTGPRLDSVVSARIMEWFGDYVFRDVVEGVKKMDAFIQGGGKVTFVDRRRKREVLISDPRNPTLDKIVPMTGCDYAYVKNLPGFKTTGLAHVGSGMRVYLGERFFHQSKATIDRTATIYHELSHKVLALSDIVYSPGPCRLLASSNSKQAVKNPDNWCYFATSFTLHVWR